MPSSSRPGRSNDNPSSESRFKTLEYRPDYPRRPFANLMAARQWVGTFAHASKKEEKAELQKSA